MPNWKKVIVSGSDAALNSLIVTSGVTGSLVGTASFALTASYVNPLNQSVIVTGSYNLQASTGQNLFFNSSGQLGSSGTGTHITMTPNGNTTFFGQVSYFQNGLNVTPGGNSTTQALGVTVGSYPSATLARFSSGSVTVLAISGSGMRGTGSFDYLGSISATSLTSSLLGTASYATQALTASFVNTLNQSVIVTGSLTVGATTTGASENTLTLGPPTAGGAGEGGQLGFNAVGGTYTSASFIDNWQNNVRILRGTNVTSTGLVAQWNLHTLQMQLPAYTNASSFVGTATANLAVDSSGNVITVSTTGGSVFPYTGTAGVTGSISATGPIYSQTNGAMYFRGGDDAEFWDINVANTVGIYGQQDATVGSIKLGSGGGTISGKSGNIGIGTINPTSASLTVNGNVWATSFTGSLFGTSSWARNAVTASYALTASYAFNPTISGSITGVDYIDFDTNNIIGTNEPAWKEGRLFYDSGSGALAMYNWEQDVTLNIGQESWLRARNQTGVTITNGSVVRLSSAIGDRPTIVLAQATDQTNTFSTGNEIIGIATHDIEHGTDGFVTTFGTVNGLNTSAYAAGDLLWVSQSAGQFTNIAPAPPFDRTFVGIVTRANPSNGSVFSTPLTPIHFHDISSVSASVYQQGDLWMYRSGSAGQANAWINTKQLSGSYGITGSLRILGNLAQGSLISASGLFSHAEGFSTRASGSFAHAEGYQTKAIGEASHAEGSDTLASGDRSHAEGYYVTSSGFYSHAEGQSTVANGNSSHAEGQLSQAHGYAAHAEGSNTRANGDTSHAEGNGTYADGDVSHAEGQYTATMEVGTHAEGLFTTAGGIRLLNVAPTSDYFTETQVYVQGDVLSQYPNSATAGAYIHFQVPYTTQPAAPADPAYDVINTTILSSSYNSGTNITTLTIPTMSNYASLDTQSGAATYVFLENIEESQTWNNFYGSNAHAEGYFTTATGRYSHAEGYQTKAFGEASHAEGRGGGAYGTGSHAEGSTTLAGRGDAYLIDTAGVVIPGSTEIIVNSKYGDLTSEFSPGQVIQYYDSNNNSYGPAMISSSIWSSPNTIIGTYGTAINGVGGSIARADTINSGDYETGGKYAHAEGFRGKAFSEYSHAEGNQTIAAGAYSHAEGTYSVAYAASSHAEGIGTQTRGDYSHAEGNSTVAYAASSHAEGEGSTAGGWGLQAPDVSSGVFNLDQAGDVTSYFTNGTQIVLVDNGPAYGSEPTAYTFTVNYSTWDGSKTIVYLTDTSLTIANKVIIGIYGQPQAFNFIDTTYGIASHATGLSSVTIGDYSYAGGDANIALGWKQHVVGKYNQTSSKAGAFIIGNGSEGGGRNNLMLAYDNRVEVTGSVMASMGFTGSLLGTAATASFLLGSVASASFATTAATASFLLGSVASATSASVVGITNNTSTNATYYPTFVSSTSGHNALNVDSSTFTWNPNTETLTAANFAGNASSATSATTAGSATSAGTATNANNIYNTSSPSGGDNLILFNSNAQNAYNQAATDTSLIYNPTSVTLQARNFRSTNSLTVSGSSILSGSTRIIGPTIITGSCTISGSTIISGSLRGNVILSTVASNTASLDFSQANFFTCSLANGATTHISASNYFPGQTVNILINQGSAGTGKVSFNAAFKSGSLYTGSAVANAVDIVTFITFDTTNIYLSAIRNLK